MTRLLRLLLQLCLFRLAPQDLPYSPQLARGLVLITLALHLVFVQLLDLGEAPSRIALALVWLLGLPWLLLGLRQRRPRYVQTLTAFAGSGLLFMLALLPLAQPIAQLQPLLPDTPPSAAQVLLPLAYFVMLVWKLALNAHIWRHALDWPRGGAVLLAIGLFLLEVALEGAVFPSHAAS